MSGDASPSAAKPDKSMMHVAERIGGAPKTPKSPKFDDKLDSELRKWAGAPGKKHVSALQPALPAAAKPESGSCGCCAGLLAMLSGDGKDAAQDGAHHLYVKHHTRRTLPDREGWDASEVYDIDPVVLGEGAFGVVKRVTRKRSGKERVMKIMNKAMIPDLDAFQNECAIQADMDHPHIVKIFDAFQQPGADGTVTLILEICRGGDVSQLLESVDHVSELDASILMAQIMRAVGYMHSQGVAHRDLKPENFLLKSNVDEVPIADNLLKVIDFGFARSILPQGENLPDGGSKKHMTSICGSAWFMAPELWAVPYDEKCDVWSCGVILFLLLSGNLPFGSFEAEDEEIFEAAKQCKLDFTGKEWQGLSPLSKLLTTQMLKLDADTRPSASAVLNSLWMKQEDKLVHAGEAPVEKEELEGVVKSLKSYSHLNSFNKAALYLVAHSLPDKDVEKLRKIFESLDTNGDGTLGIDEIVAGVDQLGLCRKDVEGLFGDMGSEGSIEYTEFLEIMIQSTAGKSKEDCWEAFRVFDTDGDRTLSIEELKSALMSDSLKDKVSEEDVAEILKQADLDGDGFIEFDEFCAMLGAIPSS